MITSVRKEKPIVSRFLFVVKSIGMHKYSFEKLDVWVISKDFTKHIYTITSSFPDTEKFGLISQLRRASVSICSNIAEGTSRLSHKEKAHFSTMAYSSAIEVLNQLIICFELSLISENDYSSLRISLETITNKINSLRKHQLSQI